MPPESRPASDAESPNPRRETGTWHFGEFEFDRQRGELRRRGKAAPILLRPKAELLLRYLLASRGRLCSRPELMAAVWPASVVTDDSLVQCIVELRAALDDRAQEMIRTVPRRGYRFEAPVSGESEFAPLADGVVADAPPEVAEAAEPVEKGPASAGSKPPIDALPLRRAHAFPFTEAWRWRVAAAAVACALVFVFGQTWHSPAPVVRIDDEVAARATVAIMPLVTSTDRPDLRSVADAVADGIAAQFATRVGMRGLGRIATASFADSGLDLAALRSRLKANFVVTGRVTPARSDGAVAEVQLARTLDGAVIWSKRFDGLAGGDELPADVGQQVVNAVRTRVAGQVADARSSNAADLTLLGWSDLDSRRSTADVLRARGRFERALASDPSSVLATNGLASTYSVERADRNRGLQAEQVAEHERLVERARSLAPNDATALMLWGSMQISRGRPDLALPALEKASHFVPSYPLSYVLIARALTMLGRIDEARIRLAPAFRLSTGDAPRTSAANALAAEIAVMQGEDEKAHDYARLAHAALPTNIDASAMLAAADALLGRADSAAVDLATLRRLWPAASVNRYDELRRSGDPVYLAQRMRLYAGLRKAGLPDD